MILRKTDLLPVARRLPRRFGSQSCRKWGVRVVSRPALGCQELFGHSNLLIEIWVLTVCCRALTDKSLFVVFFYVILKIHLILGVRTLPFYLPDHD